MNKLTILHAYLACALWTGEHDDKSVNDIGASTKETAIKDIDLFLEKAGDLLPNDLNSEQIGHDFWLTRNHHGSGFWDRELKGEIGDKLTEICHTFKELNTWVSEAGVVYFE